MFIVNNQEVDNQEVDNQESINPKFHACYKDEQEGWLVIGENSDVTNLPYDFHITVDDLLLGLATKFGNYVTKTHCEYNSFQPHIHFKFLSFNEETQMIVLQGYLIDDSKFFPWKKEFQLTL